ncbi:MAG TPA: hypothetical protein VGP57_02545 [Actinoplanes sp.]|nr:hypothetical protein [Actinoplanes sp.]
MKGWLPIAGGMLAVVLGTLWTLQGLDLIGGSSAMNGVTFWAVVGPIVALAGIALIVLGMRRRSAPQDRT